MHGMISEIFFKLFNPSADGMAAGGSDAVDRFKTFSSKTQQQAGLLNMPQIPAFGRNTFRQNRTRPSTTGAKKSWDGYWVQCFF